MEINFCKKVGISVSGVVENISGLQEGCKFKKFREDREMEDVTGKLFSELEKNAPGLLSTFACTDVFYVGQGRADKNGQGNGCAFSLFLPLDPHLSKVAEEGRPCFPDSKCRSSALALQMIIKEICLCA